MNTELLLKKVCDNIQPLLQLQPEVLDKIRQTFMENMFSKCNKCGNFFSEDHRWGTTKVSIRWGYESTGKDGDLDEWVLCRDCTEKFHTEFEPICVGCKKSVIVAMAELSAKNPDCAFYGDLEAALAYHRQKNWECARIGQHIFCEACYEELILSFKVPVLDLEYMHADPLMLLAGGEEEIAVDSALVRENRITRALKFQNTSSCVTAFVPYEEAVAIKKSPDKHKLVIRMIRMQESHKDHLTLIMGDDKTINVFIGWLEGVASLRKKHFDINQMQILNEGKILRFGELEIDSEMVIEVF